MEAPVSKRCLQTALSFAIVVLFVIDATTVEARLNDKIFARPKFTMDVHGFSKQDVKDHVIINLAKFAVQTHNVKVTSLAVANQNKITDEHCKSCSTLQTWELVEVIKARTKKVNKDLQKYALLFSATNGPIGDFCEAMVDVVDKQPKLTAFIEPKDDFGGEM